MDYPTNSHRFKDEQQKNAIAERKPVEKVITGTVKTRKKGEVSKLLQGFLAEDAPKIRSYVLHDVALPACKKALMGIIDMIFGGTGNVSYNQPSGPKIRYGKFSEEPDYKKSTGTVSARNTLEYDDIEFPNRGSAECVLSKMKDIFAEYHSVTLSEMYEAAGLECPYTFAKYGWMSLRGVEVIRRGDGYFIKLPPATLVTY